MKVIKLTDLRSPRPNKARALLGLFCQTAETRKFPGYSITPAQRADVDELDRQNTILAREIAFYLHTGDVNTLQSVGDELGAFDALVCELFALSFTYRPNGREKVEETSVAFETGAAGAWTDFEFALEQRFDLRFLAEVEVSLVRNSFFEQLKEQEAA